MEEGSAEHVEKRSGSLTPEPQLWELGLLEKRSMLVDVGRRVVSAAYTLIQVEAACWPWPVCHLHVLGQAVWSLC